MIIDLDKPLYIRDKATGKSHPVCSIYFPLGATSGKDLTVCVNDDCEWRSMDEVKFLPQGVIPSD